MTDTLSPEERSKHMSLIRSKNTHLELRVRRLIYSMGFRYRLHRRDLPGKPDLVFSPRKKIIFINGCFFHHHKGCSLARLPKSRKNYWIPKLKANAERDTRNVAALRKIGWRVMCVWECQLKTPQTLILRVKSFLNA